MPFTCAYGLLYPNDSILKKLSIYIKAVFSLATLFRTRRKLFVDHNNRV